MPRIQMLPKQSCHSCAAIRACLPPMETPVTNPRRDSARLHSQDHFLQPLRAAEILPPSMHTVMEPASGRLPGSQLDKVVRPPEKGRL